MSKLKTPRDKKEASLEHDCRNSFGENDKSSRRNIPRSKQRSHQAERRDANQPLGSLKGLYDEDRADQIEAVVKTRMISKARTAFKKSPDDNLRGIILYRKTGE
jgi:hypothetical protein